MNQMNQSDIGALIFFGFVALIFLAFMVLYIWSIVWAYADAESRKKSGCLVALLVAFVSWPFGLILWLIFRPVDKQ